LLNLRTGVFYHMATDIVANSAASQADVRQTFHVPAERCRVFYNALSDPLVHPHLQALVPSPRRIVCVGRLFPSKGQDVLLRAVALLKRENICCQVDLVGVGPAETAYKQLAETLGIRGQCVFHGRLRHDQVLAQMRSAMVVVSPSRSEAFGLVNIEALSVGTPLVASAVGGIREIIRNGREGFLVAPDNAAEFARRIKELLCDEALRGDFARAARERFLSTFEQGKILREQIQWIETTAAARVSRK
jgi:glycosyltransferase involved in cell wall biosynthesis